jgi:tetratricopeptide (TPR) repeat protein
MARSSALGLVVVLAAGGCVSFGSGPEDTAFNRGVRVGRPKQAERHYRTALKLNPEEPRALANLGQLLGERGKHAEARRLLLQATDAEPSSAYTWAALGWFELQRKKLDAAEQYFTEAIRAEPEASTGYFHMARLLEARGKRDAALEMYRTAVSFEPEDVEAMRGAVALLPAGDSAAIGFMERILLVQPEDGTLWLRLGRSYLAAGDAERAAMALWQARDRSLGAPRRLAQVQAALRRAYAALGKALPAEPPAAPAPASK